jgi:hypothetical protein
VVDSCDHSSEPSGSMKGREFLGLPSNHQVHRKALVVELVIL